MKMKRVIRKDVEAVEGVVDKITENSFKRTRRI